MPFAKGAGFLAPLDPLRPIQKTKTKNKGTGHADFLRLDCNRDKYIFTFTY